MGKERKQKTNHWREITVARAHLRNLGLGRRFTQDDWKQRERLGMRYESHILPIALLIRVATGQLLGGDAHRAFYATTNQAKMVRRKKTLFSSLLALDRM